ncbi:hypothetical protein Pelo_5418 [Pelomyxa schiedti]|nr:hypothetical protein Pelo_5418 [Pelomyxa schiedti]
MVSLCTSAYLSSSSPQQLGTTNGGGGDVDIECRVCHHVTSLSVWDVFADAPVGARHRGGALFQPGKCVLHPDRPLERFCVTDNLLVCLECALDHHRTHELVTIARQAQTTAEQVPRIVEFIKKKRTLMEESAQQTEDAIRLLTKTKKRQRRVEGHIRGTINRLMKELQKKKDALLANTSKFFETRRRSLKLHLKCTQSAVSQLSQSETQFSTSTGSCEAQTGGIPLSSLVIITCNPVLSNSSNWKTSVLLEQPLLSVCEGRFKIKQEDAPAALSCVKNMSLSNVVGEEEFALQTMRLFVEGEFKQCFDNCLEMFLCPSHGPLCEIHYNNKHDQENHVCPRGARETHNLSEAVALLLLYFMLYLKPFLFNSLGPFTKHPAVYIREVLLPRSSPESQVFLKVVTDTAHRLVRLEPPPAPRSRFWSLFQPSPEQQPPEINPHTEWKCGVAALAQVMRGFMFIWGVGDVSGCTTNYVNEWNAVISSFWAWPRPIHSSSCLKIPMALADTFQELYGPHVTSTATSQFFAVAAHFGNVVAQGMLGNFQPSVARNRVWTPMDNLREAVQWLTKASEGGDAGAQYHLAQLYETGWEGAGVRKDVAEAMRLYRLSADQGWGEAQYRLGVLLVNGCGRGTTTNGSGGGLGQNELYQQQQKWGEGVDLLLLAADQGNKKAQDKLMMMNSQHVKERAAALLLPSFLVG